jgi:hypothetical protein
LFVGNPWHITLGQFVFTKEFADFVYAARPLAVMITLWFNLGEKNSEFCDVAHYILPCLARDSGGVLKTSPNHQPYRTLILPYLVRDSGSVLKT